MHKLTTFLLILFSIIALSCNNTKTAGSTERKDSTQSRGVADNNKNATSLREACEGLIKADKDKDTMIYFSLLDTNFSITAHGRTFPNRTAFREFIKQEMSETAKSPDVHTRNLYHIEDVSAGSKEPVWAGYEKGTFESISESENGKYHRKVTGPYYRAWKLSNGKWKCYHLVVMAFTCEGDDCSPH